MSENIFATAFTDPGLQAIRDQVGLKDAALPYLLLPVKIETRFMQVDRPLVEPDVFTEIVADLSNLEKYMAFDPAKIPLHEMLGRYKKIVDSVNTVAEKANRLRKLAGNAREALVKQLNVLLKRNKELGAAIGRIITPDAKIIAQLRALRNMTEEGLQTMLAVISKLQPGDAVGNDFLLPLEAIVQALKEVAAKDLRTPDRKGKRELFGFLNERQAIITAGIKEMQLTIATNITAEKSQLKRLDALTAQLQPLGKKAATNVRNLQST